MRGSTRNSGSDDTPQVATMKRVQRASLRRIHILPDGIRDLIDANDLGLGVLTDDGQGMSHTIGGIITLTIRPFAETIELVDNSGKNSPLTIQLGANGDFDLSKVLAVAGYASLVKRDGHGQTGSDWIAKLNNASPVAA